MQTTPSAKKTPKVPIKKTQPILTPEVRSIGQAGCHFTIFGDHVHYTLLYEVHLSSYGSLLDDVVPGLEDLVVQLGDHLRHEVRVGVCEEGNRGHQGATVVVDNFL